MKYDQKKLVELAPEMAELLRCIRNQYIDSEWTPEQCVAWVKGECRAMLEKLQAEDN